MVAKPKKPLEPWQTQDAARLHEIWQGTPDRPTQAKFGQIYGLGSQGLIHQYLHGLIPLNLIAAGKFAAGLKCEIGDFSPTLAAEAEKLGAKSEIQRIYNRLPPEGKSALLAHAQMLLALASPPAHKKAKVSA